MMSLKRAVIGLSCLSLAITATAQSSTVFSYDDGANSPVWWGYGKYESYDIAIKIQGPEFVGSEITGFTVSVPDAEIPSAAGWLSSELKTVLHDGKNVNDPDICTQPLDIVDGEMSVTFDQPYTVSEEGVYIGYSLEIPVSSSEEALKQPVSVASGNNENGLFVRSSRTSKKWKAMSAETGFVSAMKVQLHGSFSGNSAMFGPSATLRTVYGEPGNVTIQVVNYGVNEIESVNWTAVIDGKTTIGESIFDPAIPAGIGAASETNITLPVIEEAGTYSLQMTIDKVNGEDNNYNPSSSSYTVVVMPFVPVNRPLMEEYTGLWCGYCPRGFTAMEVMNQKHPDDFVCISYHINDDLQTQTESQCGAASEGLSLPIAAMNRALLMDPYYGLAGGNMGIEKTWEELRSQDVDGEIWAEAQLVEGSDHIVEVNMHVRFVRDINDANYKMIYCPVGDSLTDVRFRQTNYFDSTSGLTGTPLEVWYGAGSYVKNLKYNDVAIATPNTNGLDGSIPSTIKVGEIYDYSVQFDLHECMSNYGNKDNFIDLAKLAGNDNIRFVVAILDADTSTIVNSNKTKYITHGHDSVAEIIDAEPVAETWYDLRGVRVNMPSKGMYIRVTEYSNGYIATSKIVR